MKVYSTVEELEKDYPGIDEEMKQRHETIDQRTNRILEDRGYQILRNWKELPLWSIPVEDLLAVRSSRYCRRIGSYRHYIREMHNGNFYQVPLLCFVAMDGRLRVKWGNVIYWVAKETKTQTHLQCVFPSGPEKTDALKEFQLQEAGMKEGIFL
jgi:hypothetical protein